VLTTARVETSRPDGGMLSRQPQEKECSGNCHADRVGRSALNSGGVDAFYDVVVGQPALHDRIFVCRSSINCRVHELIRRAAIG
jgi:hypothetical protein